MARARVRALWAGQMPPWDTLTVGSVRTDANRWMEGRTLGALIRESGKDAVDFVCDLLLEEDLSAAHLRLAGAIIEHLDWAECIRRYDRPATLFYCDPPYWGTTGYGVGFELAQYDRLAELARSIRGKMVISVNDIPEMRQAFGGLAMERVEITYAVGGKGRPAGRSGELVIRNF